MRSRSPHHRSFRMTIVVIGVLVMLLFFVRGVVERGLHVFQRPLVAAGTWIYERTAFLQDTTTLRHELEQTRSQLQQLAFDRIRLEELEKENKELKEALGFIERQGYQSVSASIVSRSHFGKTSLFVIDQGADHGIAVGDPVVVEEGILIGKVMSTTSASATVQTLSDAEMATAVSLLGKTQTIGVAEGSSGLLLRLKFIPQDTEIRVNDLVVSSGLESRVPAGLFVGLVNDVQPEANAPFLEAIIEPFADPRQFRVVHVLIQPDV